MPFNVPRPACKLFYKNVGYCIMDTLVGIWTCETTHVCQWAQLHVLITEQLAADNFKPAAFYELHSWRRVHTSNLRCKGFNFAPLGLIPNNALDICSTTNSVKCTLWSHMAVVFRMESMSALIVSCCLNGKWAGVLKFKRSSMCQSPLGPKEPSDICGQVLLWCVCVFGCVKMQFSM